MMIYTEGCYKKLGKTVVLQKYFRDNIDKISFSEYYGFDVSPFPIDVVLSEPLLYELNKNYKIKQGGVIRIEPNRCYTWHQDAVRGVCVNMLLTPEADSFVLFGNTSSRFDDQYDIIRLDYEPETFYLFNNQAFHTVINFNSPRYMFTIEFEQDKHTLKFEDIRVSEFEI